MVDVEFVMEENKEELERVKLKLFRAYQRLCVDSKEAHDLYTKDMSEGELKEFCMDCAYEEAPQEYYDVLGEVKTRIEGEYDVIIEWEDNVEITRFSEWLEVTLTHSVPDISKKFKDMEFTVELSQKSEFLIALMEKVAEEHSDGDE